MNPDLSLAQTLRLVIEVAATAAFALSGVFEGARKRLDAVGVCVVGVLAAFGGGTLRDLLLDQRPFFWVRHVELLWGVLLLCVVVMAVMRQRHFAPTERAMLWPDALGLGLFTATGVQVALETGMPALVAVLMGMVTGVFGGVLRDIVCNEIPVSFKDHRPYALCSVAGGVVYIVLDALNSEPWFCMALCALVTVIIRTLAIWKNWVLPAWRKD